MNLSRDDEDTLDTLFLATTHAGQEWSPWGYGNPSERTLFFERIGLVEREFGNGDEGHLWRGKLTKFGARDAEERIRTRRPQLFAMG